ncbi:hypothetical protein H0H87_009147 [Tephrocybe sp. NHM501043]|nr:hypothetical protein H0H87_009147 [Tephrocybe sp. NHM501043]
MAYTIRKLTHPTHEQIEELRAVFDAAFATERGFECVVGPSDFSRILPVLNRSQIVAGTLGGEIYIAEDDNGNIIGGIIWYGPGHEQYDSEEQREQALAPLMESLSGDVKAWFASSNPKMAAFKKAAFGDLAKTEWYLQRVGVHPDWQGKGLGTALIKHGEQKVWNE